VGAGFQGRFEIGVDVRWWRGDGRRERAASGTKILGLLILVPESGGQRFGEMLGDEVGSEAWEGVEMALSYGTNECGGCWAAKRGVVIGSELLLGLVETEDAIGLMSRSSLGSRDGNGPETTGHAFARDDDVVVFEKFHVILGEDGNAIVVAKLG